MRKTHRFAGWAIVAGAVGLAGVFVVLGVTFDYPAVLDHPARDVLGRLLAGGLRLRLIWGLYAVLPLTLVAAAWSLRGLPGAPRGTDKAGVASGLAMTIGLARWPTVQWKLARAWVAMRDAVQQASVEARFDQLNLVLGRVVGEFIGEVALSTWLAGVGWALRGRLVGRVGLVLAASMLVGAFRNVVPALHVVTAMTNNALLVVLIWLGVTLIRAPLGRAGGGTSTTGLARGRAA